MTLADRFRHDLVAFGPRLAAALVVAVAWSLVAQFGLFLHDGRGQLGHDALALLGLR